MSRCQVTLALLLPRNNPMAVDGKILAIITARGGSKGLPQKNILDCAGKPLIAWTIEAAIKSNFIDSVLVSTDSQKISEVALEYGAWVPFLRASKLAEDESSIVDVVKDVLHQLSLLAHEFDYLLLLQPTTPLRTTIHIDQAIEKYFSTRTSDLGTLVSVKKVNNKVLWVMGEAADTGYIFNHYNLDLSGDSRRQNLPNCFMPNGAIYLAKVDGFNGFYGDKTRSYVMDEISSMDIDYQHDLDRVVAYMQEQGR